MDFVKELLDSLKNEKSKSLLLPDALTFPKLDIDAIERETCLIENAIENGKNNFPKQNSTNFDATQNKIIEIIHSTIRPLQASYSEAVTAYSARLAALDPLGFDAQIRGMAAKKKAEIKMVAAQAKGDIYLYEKNLKQREQEYEDFKKNNEIKNDPIEGLSKFAKWTILLALVVFEGVMNSFFIGPYMMGGLLEGLAYAVAIPLLSVIFFGLAAGVSLRKITVASGFYKLIYGVIISIALVCALSINFLLASLRIAVELTEDYQAKAMDIWLSYLKLSPIESLNTAGVLLVLVGMACFLIASLDIKSLDHPIKGFWESFRARKDAHSDYNNKMNSLNKNLMFVANSAKEITNSFGNLQLWQTEYHNIIINRTQLSVKYAEYIKYIESVANTLLFKYRELNSKNRSDDPPKYYQDQWVYPEFISIQTETSVMVSDFQNKIQNVYKNLEQIQCEIDDEISILSNVITPTHKAVKGKL